jgi:hypothetical protein
MISLDLKVGQLEELGMKAVVHVDAETGYAERVEVVDGPTYSLPEQQQVLPEETSIDSNVVEHLHKLVVKAALIGLKRYRNIQRTCDESWLRIVDHLNSVASKSVRCKDFVVLKTSQSAGFEYPVHFSVDSIFEESVVLSWFCESPLSPAAFEALLEVHDFESAEYPPPLRVAKVLEFAGNERSAEIQNMIAGKWYKVNFRAIGGQWCEPINVVTKKAYAK